MVEIGQGITLIILANLIKPKNILHGKRNMLKLILRIKKHFIKNFSRKVLLEIRLKF